MIHVECHLLQAAFHASLSNMKQVLPLNFPMPAFFITSPLWFCSLFLCFISLLNWGPLEDRGHNLTSDIGISHGIQNRVVYTVGAQLMLVVYSCVGMRWSMSDGGRSLYYGTLSGWGGNGPTQGTSDFLSSLVSRVLLGSWDWSHGIPKARNLEV